MSTIRQDVIEYPESDGQPMGETDLHKYWIVRLHDLLQTHYEGQQVYIGSDLLVYYEEGKPQKFVVPDVFVVFDIQPGLRRTFRIWEECRVPSVVFEVSSRSTAHKDLEEKPKLYAQLGVQEYFLFDPEADYLNPALQGFRLRDGKMESMDTSKNSLQSLLCQCQLRLEDGCLELLDLHTNQPWLTAAESAQRERDYYRVLCDQARIAKELECQAKERERLAKEQERAAKEQERAAKEQERAAKEQERAAKEQERAAKEQERAAKEQEREAKERERAAKEQERAARLAAEAEVIQLRAELERLKGNA